MDYLVGDNDFLNLKNRKFEIPVLNETKVRFEKSEWQLMNLFIPLNFIVIIGLIFIFSHRKKYRKVKAKH